METWNDRMNALLKVRKSTQLEMLSTLGFNKGQLTNWKKRGTIPDEEALRAVCEYLNTSPEYLLLGQNLAENETN